MSQISEIVEILKKNLKAHGLNYIDVAKLLKVSESSVKRLFSQKNFDLNRLEKICSLVNMNLTDLFAMLSPSKNISQLTMEQEKALVDDHKLLLVATCVINKWKLSDILYYYDIKEHECVQKLLYLNEIKIIDLLPNNKFKLKINPHFSWLPNGPVQQFFQKNLQEDFFSTQFLNPEEALVVRFGMLSKESNVELQKKFSGLIDSFIHLCQEDSIKPLNERNGSVLVIGLRPWISPILAKYKK